MPHYVLMQKGKNPLGVLEEANLGRATEIARRNLMRREKFTSVKIKGAGEITANVDGKPAEFSVLPVPVLS